MRLNHLLPAQFISEAQLQKFQVLKYIIPVANLFSDFLYIIFNLQDSNDGV